jgi:hypothetical protein
MRRLNGHCRLTTHIAVNFFRDILPISLDLLWKRGNFSGKGATMLLVQPGLSPGRNPGETEAQDRSTGLRVTASAPTLTFTQAVRLHIAFQSLGFCYSFLHFR